MGDSETVKIEIPPAIEAMIKQRPQGASIIREEFFMGFAISALLFLAVMAVGGFISLIVLAATNGFLGGVAFAITFFCAWFVSAAVRIALQWERAIVLRLGKLKGLRGPGMFFIIPIIEAAAVLDTRIQTLDIPKQQVITKDNVPVTIDAVLFFRVVDPIAAIVNVQSYTYAVTNYAQATLRDVIGGMTLDELLAERQKIGDEIEKFVEAESKNWGLEITNIKIQDINMPEDLKRMMSRQASAEREKRANITKAEGDMLAAVNLAAAAKTMATSNGAMQLRTLQTIDGLGPTASNTVVLAVPIEIMEAIKAFTKNQEAK
jgi:regulator of protease activity HflC (stomatin/prohibitin superfamily)